MQFDVHWIDVNPNLALGQQPVYMIERPLLHGDQVKGGVFINSEVARAGVYWVPQSEVTVSPIEWAVTATGQYVRVPVFAYRCPQRAEASMLWMGAQLGMQVLDELCKKTASPILQATLILGHQCHDLGEQGVRGYLGLSFQTKE